MNLAQFNRLMAGLWMMTGVLVLSTADGLFLGIGLFLYCVAHSISHSCAKRPRQPESGEGRDDD